MHPQLIESHTYNNPSFTSSNQIVVNRTVYQHSNNRSETVKHTEIIIADSNGNDVQTIVENAYKFRPTLSPSGNFLAGLVYIYSGQLKQPKSGTVSSTFGLSIYHADAEKKGNVKGFIETTSYPRRFAWSPDETQIVVVEGETAPYSLRLYDINSKSLIKTFPLLLSSPCIAWAGGEKIAANIDNNITFIDSSDNSTATTTITSIKFRYMNTNQLVYISSGKLNQLDINANRVTTLSTYDNNSLTVIDISPDANKLLVVPKGKGESQLYISDNSGNKTGQLK